METNPLVIRGLSRKYDGHHVLDGVDLTLAPGQITGLLGPSGAGKSTLLRLIAGLESANAGKILIGDALLSSSQKNVSPEKRKIGLIFQDFALFPHLTLLQNIMFGLTAYRKSERRNIAQDWLEKVRLGERAKAYPHELSGGQQQRVAIARALAPGPRAILMDEPFSGLDSALRDVVRAEVLALVRAANIPALLVTHDPDEALAHCEQLAIMDSGKIVQYDTPQAIYSTPVSAKAAAALGPVQAIDAQDLPAALLPANMREGEVFLREGAIEIVSDSDIKAEIISVQFAGRVMRLGLELGSVSVIADGASATHWQIGQSVGVTLRSDFVFRF